MTDYSKITALYSRLSVGDEDRDGGESNSIQNQKIFLENYARGQHLTNIRHYIDDDESGRFFDRSAYSRMMDDVENGKIGVCIMKDLTRWGRDYLQVGNAMEIFRRNSVRFIAVNKPLISATGARANGFSSLKPPLTCYLSSACSKRIGRSRAICHWAAWEKKPCCAFSLTVRTSRPFFFALTATKPETTLAAALQSLCRRA